MVSKRVLVGMSGKGGGGGVGGRVGREGGRKKTPEFNGRHHVNTIPIRRDTNRSRQNRSEKPSELPEESTDLIPTSPCKSLVRAMEHRQKNVRGKKHVYIYI